MGSTTTRVRQRPTKAGRTLRMRELILIARAALDEKPNPHFSDNSMMTTTVAEPAVKQTPEPPKVPPAEGASQELLSRLAKEHVNRVTAGRAQSIAESQNTAASAPEANKADATLQREISALLGKQDPSQPLAAKDENPKDDGPKNDAVSAAELDSLLSQAEIADAPAAPASSANAQAAGADVEATIAEAEGVVAAELSALLEKKQDTEATAPPAKNSEKDVASDTSVMGTPVDQASPEPVAAATNQSPAATAEPTENNPAHIKENPTATQSQPAPESAKDAATPPPAAAPPAPEISRQRSTSVPGLKRIHDLVLTAAQVMDIPFSRMPESIKQMIGVVAIALLAGGIALIVATHYQK